MTEAALSDVRVIDLAGEMGLYCTKLLADLGADVIRVEPPDGDPARMMGPFYHDERQPDRSLTWFNLNTNKRSVTLDITTDDGRALLEKLTLSADVVVETFEPGYLESLGLGYGRLSAEKPEIVVTSITGFGQSGPHARWKATDIVGVAMSGMMTLAGDKEDPPNKPYDSQGYIGASIQGAAGTLMALVHRDATGEGQHVDVSMQEALSINQETAMQTYDMQGTLRQRTGARGALPINVPGIGVYNCSDGEVFAYLGTPGGAGWPVMLDWMDREGKAEDLTEEPYRSFVGNLNMRFLTGLMTQPEKIPENLKLLGHVYEVFERFCASMSKWTLYEEGQRQRLMFGIVSTPEDLVNNPQLQARSWLQDVRHDELNATIRYAGPPYRLSETPWAIRRRPPLPGEHNREVYLGELGMGEDDLSRLLAARVI